MADDNMQEGIIARLTDKGFGFITREGEEKDLFFHSNEQLQRELEALGLAGMSY